MKKSIQFIIALGIAASISLAVQAGEGKECEITATKTANAAAAECSAECADKALSKVSKVEYQVAGMSCGACENKLTAALSKLQGVSAPKACSKSSVASVSYDAAKVKPQEIIAAIKKAGYKVEGEIVTMKVDGLKCGACVDKVGKALSGLKGVSKQEVCSESHVAKVVFDPEKLDAKKIAAAIDATGFKAAQ